MATMRAMQVPEAGGDFELVEREIPEPGRGEVRVRVEACGICHSDMFTKEGAFPGIQYPRVPGHEVAGTIDAVGEGVERWEIGRRVGVGWHGWHCGGCPSCKQGDFVTCAYQRVSGIAFDGGYADYMIAPVEALAAIPDALSAVEAAPLLCAGVTTYNALRNSGARAGDVVAIQGVGGLGHLAIQYAARMGFHTVALSRGSDKKALALELGAATYIDTEAQDPCAALQAIGGARVILATAPSAKLMSAIIEGLGVNGKLIVVGADPKPIEVSPLQLLPGRRSISGHPSGAPVDSEDTMRFSGLKAIRAQVETYPLEQAAQAYARMMANEARFRVVLTMT